MSKQKSKEEMYSIVESWKESGLSKKQFCNREGIATGTFYYWLDQYLGKGLGKQQELRNFQEVLPVIEQQLDICYPNGVMIKVPKDSSLSVLQQLIGLV